MNDDYLSNKFELEKVDIPVKRRLNEQTCQIRTFENEIAGYSEKKEFDSNYVGYEIESKDNSQKLTCIKDFIGQIKNLINIEKVIKQIKIESRETLLYVLSSSFSQLEVLAHNIKEILTYIDSDEIILNDIVEALKSLTSIDINNTNQPSFQHVFSSKQKYTKDSQLDNQDKQCFSLKYGNSIQSRNFESGIDSSRNNSNMFNLDARMYIPNPINTGSLVNCYKINKNLSMHKKRHHSIKPKPYNYITES